MKSFLEEVIEELLLNQTDFIHTTIVIPGVRPKSFIKKTFASLGYRGILPHLQTIEELLQEISGLKLISPVPLLFSAYEAHLSSAAEPGDFEDFLKYIPTLLKDFDDIDSSLCDDSGLLNYLISEERINKWGANMEIGLSDIMKNHLSFWTDAMALFYQLRYNLKEEGKAYRGLLGRTAAENAQAFILKSSTNYIFTGFNALTNAEFEILKSFHDEGKSINYWDADTYYLNDKKQEAGDFLRKYREQFSEDFKFVNNHFVRKKSLKIINVPRLETQAKYVGKYLSQLAAEEREKTAVVLGDEQLLPAVLNSLPPEVEKLNITMGMPLNMVPLSGFFRKVFNLHMSAEKFKNKEFYYYRHVLDIIENSNFRTHFQPQLYKIREIINQDNIIFVPVKTLDSQALENPFFKIFKLPDSPVDLLDIIVKWIDLQKNISEVSDLEKEYLFRFRSVFMQLIEETASHPYITSYKTLFQLYQQLLQLENISFVGDPLVGLQVLGMLETRLLDFKHIILTGVNEGTLPLGRQENSFIPFEHRKNFGLNTFLENDAIYAYHFYRLIQRSESVSFLYNSDADALTGSEPSRFLLQLLLESPHEPKEIIASPAYDNKLSTSITIPKTDVVLEMLEDWKDRISPSSLGTYLYNPLQFYHRYVLKIYQEDEVEEIAGDMTLGNIVHEVLQLIYENYLNEILTTQHFTRIENEIETVFRDVTNKLLLKNREATGKNVLILQVAKEMINNVLRKDKNTAAESELIIKGVEQVFSREFITPSGKQINFYGKIDRIDSLNGITRLLDYKTGTVKTLEIKTNNIEKILEKDGAQIIQLAIYSYMFKKENILSGIYPLRYFSEDIKTLQIDKVEELIQEKTLIVMEKIGNLIDEIFDSELPFFEPEV